MLPQETLTYIIGITVLANVALTVYNSLRKPQVDLEKEDIKVQNKANSLVQQVEWEKQATSSRFKEIQDSFYKILEVNQNHLHTLEVSLNKHIEDNTKNNLEVAKTLSHIETLISTHLK